MELCCLQGHYWACPVSQRKRWWPWNGWWTVLSPLWGLPAVPKWRFQVLFLLNNILFLAERLSRLFNKLLTCRPVDWLYFGGSIEKVFKTMDSVWYRYGPPVRTEHRVIVENLSSRISWQVSWRCPQVVSSENCLLLATFHYNTCIHLVILTSWFPFF